MKSILELWYGNIDPSGEKYETKEAKELLLLLSRHKDALHQMLGKKDADIFDLYCENAEEKLHLNSSLAFCNGFSIGLRLASEAFIHSEELLK